MNLSIIIPAHNEEASIERVIRAIEEKVAFQYEIIIVDDHSSDNTASIINSLALDYGNIRLISNLNKPGFTQALKAGFNNSEADFVLPVMADLCDDPETINRMWHKINEGFDIICASRYMKGGEKIGGPLLKTFFSRFVGLSLHWLVGVPSHDISNSFKLYRKKMIECLKLESNGFEISAEIPLKAYFLGYKITEVPTVWRDRQEGSSKFKIGKQGPAYLKLYLWAIWKKITSI